MSLLSMVKSGYNSVTGNIDVVESGKYITIRGINGNRLVDTITSIWSTTRIANYIFKDVSFVQVRFHKFFLLDIIYTLEKLSLEPRIAISRRSVLLAIEKLKELTEFKSIFIDGGFSLIDRSRLNLFNTNPLPWQSEYLDIYSDRITKYRLKGHLLDAKPGTGKTLASLMLMESLRSDTILVVSPKNAVIDVWKNTLDKYYKQYPRYWHSLSGYSPISGSHIYVIHYEYLSKFLEFLNKTPNSSMGKVSLVTDECTHPDTEVLTKHDGFKKIKDVTVDDLILQYHPDGSSWVNPSRVVKKATLEIHRYQNEQWEQVVTPNHRMIFVDYKLKIKEVLSRNYTDVHSSLKTIVADKENNSVFLVDNKDTIKTVEHLDKPVDFYCVTVPTGMFYVRYNNKISITGNCHNFNEISSNRTKSLIEISKRYSTYNLFMSGTPIKALGKEVIPLLNCVDSLFDREAEESFLKVFGKNSDRALDILAHRMGILTHTVKKEDVVSDVKLYRYQANVKLDNGQEYTISNIKKQMKSFVEERSKYYKDNMNGYVAMYLEALSYYEDTIKNKPLLQQEYLEYKRDATYMHNSPFDPVSMKEMSRKCNHYERTKIIPALPSELKIAFRKSKSVYKYVNLTIMGECLGSILGKARTKCNVDIATHLGLMELKPLNNGPDLGTLSLDEIINNASKKTIMFTSFVDVVNATNNRLKQHGYQPTIVYGETNKDLPRIVSDFQNKDIINPLIATFQSLSTAVPLTMANTIIMLNIPFREKDYTQAVARAHRKGQDKDVYVIDVLLDTGSEPNISTRSRDIANDAALMVAKIMGIQIDDTTLQSLTSEDYMDIQETELILPKSNKSEETCVACNQSNPPGDLFKHDADTSGGTTQANDDSRPYYKTDVGPTVDATLQLLGDDFYDNPDNQVDELDVKPKDTIGTSANHGAQFKSSKYQSW